MKTVIHTKLLKFAVTMTFVFATTAAAQATSLITNGGFEAGLAGWTPADALGGDGTFSPQTGTASPISGYSVPAPPKGPMPP